MKKSWKTIDKALKKRCNTGKFPTEFIIKNKSITDHKEIPNQFNIFFSNIGSNLSASIELDDNTLAFTDYLDDPTEHRFNFSKVTENEIVVIINNLRSKNSSGKDNKLLKSIISGNIKTINNHYKSMFRNRNYP